MKFAAFLTDRKTDGQKSFSCSYFYNKAERSFFFDDVLRSRGRG